MASSTCSEGELLYIAEGFELGVRCDGRGCTDLRPLEFELGVIPNATSSARLHVGATDVIVAIKAELESPSSDAPDCGKLHVGVEYSACASPEYEGRGGEEWGVQLARALADSLQGWPGRSCGVDLRSLAVVPAKVCWCLYVDALVLNDDGAVLPALSAATLAALATCALPGLEVSAPTGAEPEVELDDDPAAATQLQTANVPLIATVSQVGAVCALDLTAAEERCSAAALHIAVSSRGQLCGVSKQGTGSIQVDRVQEMMEIAQQHVPGVISQIHSFVNAKQSRMDME